MKKIVSMLLAVAMTGAMLAGCGSGNSSDSGSADSSAADTGTTVDSDTLYVALDRDCTSLDPALVYSPDNYIVERSMVEALMTNDENGDLAPNLAKSYSVSDDGLQYTFELRDDVYFWDGTQMTSEDVKFCLERVCDEAVASPVAWMNGCIDSIECNGDFEVVINMSYTDPAWIYYTASSACSIYSKAYCEEHADDFGTYLGGIMGTGPYKYDEWVEGEYVSVVKNENYWDKDNQPQYDKVKFAVMSDKATLIAAFEKGEIQYHSNLSITDKEALEDSDKVDVFEVNTNKTQIMFLNTTSEALDDKYCRKALACCWDAVGFQESVWGDAAVAGDQCVIPPSMRGSDDPELQAMWDEYFETSESYEYNLDQAKEYLAQSDSPDGFEMTIVVSNADSSDETAALYLQSTAAEIGITINVSVVTPSERTGLMFDESRSGYDALIVGWDADCPDAGTYVATIDTIENLGDGGCNMSAYYNEEVDALLQENWSIIDEKQRTYDLTEALKIITDDCVTINLCYPKRIFALSKGVTGSLYNLPNTEFVTWTNRMAPKA